MSGNQTRLQAIDQITNRAPLSFEKMVSNAANNIERHELNNLYQEFINDGREDNLHKSVNSIQCIVAP